MTASANHVQSYIESHQAPGRGEAYDTFYAEDPEVRYLWQQERRVLRQLLRDFYPENPVHLLDFACGTGRITRFLESRVASSCGVDVSEAMLSVARQKLRRTTVLSLNLLEDCPLRAQSFNLITAFRFFLNAEPELRSAALRTLEPLLAQGGCLVFNVHQNRHSLYYGPTWLYYRLRHVPAVPTLTIDECRPLLEQVGLRICRVYPVGLLHLPKLRFSGPARKRVDGWAMRWRGLSRFSDSPIVVARRATERP